MTKLTDREPVALAGFVQGLLPLIGSGLVLFDVWDPTEDQLKWLGLLFTFIIAQLTGMARGSVWSKATRDKEKVEEAALLGGVLTERAQAVNLAEKAMVVAESKVQPLAPPAPPAPPWIPPTDVKPGWTSTLSSIIGPVGGRDPSSEGNL